MSDESKKPDPYENLREMSPWVRSDLSFTRQLYQGQAVYMVHDPVNFKNHRLSPEDYRVISRFNGRRNLHQIYESLVSEGELDAGNEKDFYEFIHRLHHLSLISLPVCDGQELFKRGQRMEKASRQVKLFGFLFVKIPLANPDRFLDRTVGLASWLFAPWFVAIWLVGMASAAYLLINRQAELLEPLNGILAAQNLPFLWFALVGLKVWHELGHGYACKKYGGRVPEMGAMLLAGMPAAYVDASAAWAFRTRWQRIVVMCGGMYFESIVAMIAIVVWSTCSHPFLASCAFQLFVMAGFITIFFNANPLMRYDGYYILSELMGIQNLRSRADSALKSFWKRVFLGIRPKTVCRSRRERYSLATFAIAAAIYKQVLILSIALMFASQYPLIGLALAGLHIGTTVWRLVQSVMGYLLFSPETEPVRVRARVVAAGFSLGIPALLFVTPLPGGVRQPGSVGFETESIVRTEVAGFLEEIRSRPGDRVTIDQPLVRISNLELRESHDRQQFALAGLITTTRDAVDSDFHQVSQLMPLVEQKENEVQHLAQRLAQLQPTAPVAGRIAEIVGSDREGTFMKPGDVIATIVDGRPIIRTWVNSNFLKAVQTKTGTPVSVQIPGADARRMTATIDRILPSSRKSLRRSGVTQEAGESILVDPQSGRPTETLFEVQLTFERHTRRELNALIQTNDLHLDQVVSLRFPRTGESIGSWAFRKIRGFVQGVSVSR